MKVKELIEKLKAFDSETLVVVGGFDEEGYADLTRLEIIDVVPRKSQADIFGEYQDAKPGEKSNRALWIDHN